jgi:hypothetical protein
VAASALFLYFLFCTGFWDRVVAAKNRTVLGVAGCKNGTAQVPPFASIIATCKKVNYRSGKAGYFAG